MITWDNLALLCALLACLLRLWDRHQASGVFSSLTLLCAVLARRAQRRRERAALAALARGAGDRAAVAGDAA